MQRTILVIDRDGCLGLWMARLPGFRVRAVTSAQEALRLARTEQPCLALLDLKLEDGHGMILARQLREEFPDLILIVVTADSWYLDRHPDVAECFHRILAKPVDLVDLHRTIAVALAGFAGLPADNRQAAGTCDS